MKQMHLRLYLIGLSLIPICSFGASKEIVELQRDLATLQDQVRTMQSSTTEKLTALTVLVQQTLDASNAANRAVAVLDSRMNERFERELSKVGQPVASVGAKVDQMGNDFAGMHDVLNDVVARLGKLDQKLSELNNTIRTIQAPPPPPAGALPGTTGGAAPPLPPDTLYDNASRDRMGGKPDLALKEFSDYVQLYGDTDKAASAQYWIGQIFWDQGDYANAVKNFDLVLERYPQGNKTADAMYMKGQSLVKMGEKTDGAKEFRSIISKFPNSEVRDKACTQLKSLGFTCTAAPAARKKAAKPRA
jgi:tol-pal system protein YbgF